MSRPEFITNEDIIRWSETIDRDLPKHMSSDALIREVCYAGQWLVESLQDLQCPEEIITRIQYTAGRLSFGREPWAVHQMLLSSYQSDELVFEENLN